MFSIKPLTGEENMSKRITVADLPEFMREADFIQRYGGVGAPGYLAMMKEIEGRLNRLVVFR